MIRVLRLSPLVLWLIVAVGCGSKLSPVNGVVTLDGKPVAGATVTFVTSDGKMSATGYTDDSGSFSLSAGSQLGAYPGDYKVVVVKGRKVAGDEGMATDSTEYMKQMKSEAAESGKIKNPADAMKQKMMGGKGPASTPGAPNVKSDLPTMYATATTTPLTVKVPPDNQPVQIELKSK